MENKILKKKMEVKKCLDEIINGEIMEFVFPMISQFKGIVRENAESIVEQYLQKEKFCRITPRTIAGASIYLAIANLYEQGKLPKKIAQADAANASERCERAIRLAVKKIKYLI